MRSLICIMVLMLTLGTVWAQDQPLQPGAEAPPPPPGYGYPGPGDPPGPPPEYAQPNPGAPGRGDRLPGLSRLLMIPDLTAEQRERLCSEASVILMKISQLRAEQSNLQVRKTCAEHSETATPEEIKEIYQRSGEVEGEIFLARKELVNTVRSILTEDQIRQLKDGRRDAPRRR